MSETEIGIEISDEIEIFDAKGFSTQAITTGQSLEIDLACKYVAEVRELGRGG